jgi:hypothetical protein
MILIKKKQEFMAIKKCIQCENEFEPKNKSGQEQKFCSRSCRNKHHNERRQENLFEKFKNEHLHKATSKGNEIGSVPERSYENSYPTYNGYSFEKTIDLIQRNAELSSENKRLLDKLENLQRDYNELEMEFEELDAKIGENDSNGIGATMGNIAKEYAPLIATYFMSKNQNAKPQSNGK